MWVKNRLKFVVSGLLALSLAVAGCGGAKPEEKQDKQTTQQPPAQQQQQPQQQEQKPKPKGEITLYTSESQEQVNEMKADFESLYPDVKVNIFRSGTGEVIAKLKTEMEANQVKADLIWFADYAFFESIKDKALLAYDSPEAKNLDAAFKYSGGKFYEVRQIFNVVAWNTKKVTTPPTGWKDLTDPAHKGKVAMPSPMYSGAAFSTMGTLVKMDGFGWDYYKALKENEVKVERGNGGVATKLASGEYQIASIVDFMVRNAKKDGSPVDYVWPKEGAVLIPTPVGIMKDTQNPEAAKAFIDYLLSERGQKLFLKQNYIPVKAGIGIPEGTPDLKQLKLAATDYAYIEQNRESLQTEYTNLFPQ